MGAYSQLSEAERAELRRRDAARFAEARARLNRSAADLAPKLLRNGRKAGRHWEAANINDDATGSYSLKVNIGGSNLGHWTDFARAKGQDGRSGDIFSLMMERQFGGDFLRAKAEALRMTGVEDLSDVEFAAARARSEAAAAVAEKEEDKRLSKFRGAAWLIWKSAVPIASRSAEGDAVLTPAFHYLAGRGIDVRRMGKVPGSLRYHPRVWNTEAREAHGKDRAHLPAMVASVNALNGDFQGVHRHWLDLSAGEDGPVGKAKLEEAKMSFGTSLGGHIAVWKGEHRHPLHKLPAGTAVYMSEGVEDALSVAIAQPRLRVIAGVSLSKMGEVDLPEQMGDLVLIGQNDPLSNVQAIEAFERAIAMHQARGRTVRTMFPPEQFKDFNDMLVGKRRG